jgi:hypothetical protein
MSVVIFLLLSSRQGARHPAPPRPFVFAVERQRQAYVTPRDRGFTQMQYL